MPGMSTIEANMHVLVFLHKCPEWANEVKIENLNGELAILMSPNATGAFVTWMTEHNIGDKNLGRKFLRFIDDVSQGYGS